LLEQYRPDIAMPDLRHELAQCPHRRDMSNPCQVKYVDCWRILIVVYARPAAWSCPGTRRFGDAWAVLALP
jgi:hypothetical protein